jgi:NAD(P)-dependent dehydrogenase (short-subunit alcohol dehydrogenase family)
VLDERLGLAGRTVVVAGAGGGGIGTAICRILVEAGAIVAAFDRDLEKLALSELAMDEAGGSYESLSVDVRDPDAVADAVAQTAAEGPIDGLVHVAGGLFNDQWGSLLDTEPETFDEIVRLNLHSAFVTTRAVSARLVEQGTGGSIVHMASIAGLSAMPFGAAYAAAKAGMITLARTAALELGHAGVRVNTVAAGTVRTPRNEAQSAPDDNAAERAAIPLGRRGRPDDIAGAVLFLLSGLSAFVSGQVLAVDGGSSARPSYLDDDNLPVVVRDPELRARLLGEEGKRSATPGGFAPGPSGS